MKLCHINKDNFIVHKNPKIFIQTYLAGNVETRFEAPNFEVD